MEWGSLHNSQDKTFAHLLGNSNEQYLNSARSTKLGKLLNISYWFDKSGEFNIQEILLSPPNSTKNFLFFSSAGEKKYYTLFFKQFEAFPIQTSNATVHCDVHIQIYVVEFFFPYKCMECTEFVDISAS